MRALLESAEFRAELPGWALRGFLCAANSAVWAVLMGFQAPEEIVGMAAGVAFWVAGFAGFCAWKPAKVHGLHPEYTAALKWAVWIKIGITAFGWLLFALGSMLNSDALSQMGMLGMVDMLLGLAALAAVAFVAGLNGPEMVASADSLGWTALTTVTEGALVAVVLCAIATVLWIFWRESAGCGVNWKFLRASLTHRACA